MTFATIATFYIWAVGVVIIVQHEIHKSKSH